MKIEPVGELEDLLHDMFEQIPELFDGVVLPWCQQQCDRMNTCIERDKEWFKRVIEETRKQINLEYEKQEAIERAPKIQKTRKQRLEKKTIHSEIENTLPPK